MIHTHIPIQNHNPWPTITTNNLIFRMLIIFFIISSKNVIYIFVNNYNINQFYMIIIFIPARGNPKFNMISV